MYFFSSDECLFVKIAVARAESFQELDPGNQVGPGLLSLNPDLIESELFFFFFFYRF